MIQTSTVALSSEGTRRFDAFYAAPEKKCGVGLLIRSEMFGVNDPMRELAEGYARRGLCVLVPNVFWRSHPDGVLDYDGAQHQAAWDRLRAFDYEVCARDIGLAVEWLRASPQSTGKVAAIGFCMGGRLAFLAASRAKVDAAISLYALGIPHHLAELDHITCPLDLHYGLTDRNIPRSEIDAIAEAVAGRDDIDIYLYPDAGHSFFNPVRPGYNKQAADLAASRIDRILTRLEGDS